jgi:putative FmdB family regulatory protein
MPFYEYECTNCKFYVEALQKISDAPLIQCPSCKKKTLKKLVSAPNFRLKGGGWYETDFKSDKEEKRNLAKDEAPPVEAKSDTKDAKSEAKESKSEAKVESKAESKAGQAKKTKPAAKKAPVKSTKPAKKPAKSKPAAKKK